MTKNKVIIPKVVRGGVAIPIGNNYYYMKGRKHSNGGIDIGNDPKTGLEVESDEIVHMTPKEVKVFSAVPFINGNSPAQLVLDGVNPNKVFEIQEKFKDKNNIKDDGTKAKNGIKKIGDKEKLQELRDIHFKVKAPNTKIINEDGSLKLAYRGDNNNHNVLRENYIDDEVGDMYGIYTTFDKKYAKRYGSITEYYINSENPLYTKGNWTGVIDEKTKNTILDNGYDIIINENFDNTPKILKPIIGKRTENILFNNKKIKSSNSITYDDAGKIIPLSKRDNFNISDIRYSYIPILLGMSSLVNKKDFNLYDIKKLENNKYKYGGKTNNNKNNMTNIIQIQANGKDRLMFIPSTGRRAERSGAHRTIAAVGTKTKNNNNTSTNKKKLSNAVISDLIGTGANIIGGITSNIINRNMLDSLNEPVKPTPVVASKLKTTVNVSPQLDEIRETSNAIVRDINNNTASSRTALNRIQLGRLSDMINTNKVYSTKENIETELINKDAINRQQVAVRNAEAYDKYLAAKTAFENDIIDKQSENNIGLVSNIVGSIQDVIARNEQRRKESYDRRTLASMSPNSVEYMYNLGLIPEDEYKMYMTGINMNKDKKVSRAIKNDLFAKATTPYKLVNNNYTAPKVLKPIEY